MTHAQRLPPWPDLAPLEPVLASAHIVGLFEWDIRGARIYPCLGMARIFGLDDAAIQEGAPPAAFLKALHPADRAAFLGRAGPSRRTGDRTIYRIARRPGPPRTIMDCMRLSTGPDGAPDWACGALFDYPGPRTDRFVDTLAVLDTLDRAAALAIELRRAVEPLQSPTLKTLLDMVLMEIASTISVQMERPDQGRLN